MSPPAKPEKVYLIKWPESQRIMNHPKAKLVVDDDNSNSYIIPIEVWNEYKDTYYKGDE
jgi:hypothetical protein